MDDVVPVPPRYRGVERVAVEVAGTEVADRLERDYLREKRLAIENGNEVASLVGVVSGPSPQPVLDDAGWIIKARSCHVGPRGCVDNLVADDGKLGG